MASNVKVLFNILFGSRLAVDDPGLNPENIWSTELFLSMSQSPPPKALFNVP